MAPSQIRILPRRSSSVDEARGLLLREATIDEQHYCWTLNANSWRGPLTENAYYLREAHLGSQDLTRNGGITYWVLVANGDVCSKRDPEGRCMPNILSACETIRKPSIVFDRQGRSEEVVCYGIGGVYTSEDNRGKGYAKVMLSLLGKTLKERDGDGKRCGFSVLYSDIGKNFYSALGWKPHPSSHLSIPATIDINSPITSSKLRLLHTHDLHHLCKLDTDFLIQYCQKQPYDTQYDARTLQLPTFEVTQWHHAREEFVGQYTRGRVPEIKGAWYPLPKHTQPNPTNGSINHTNGTISPLSESLDSTVLGDGIFATWTHDFSENKLSILRLHVPSTHSTSLHATGVQKALESILRAAAAEAAEWEFKEVQAWNPQTILLEAANEVFGKDKCTVVDREETSICSLMWYDRDHARGEMEPSGIEWMANEKYTWC